MEVNEYLTDTQILRNQYFYFLLIYAKLFSVLNISKQ